MSLLNMSKATDFGVKYINDPVYGGIAISTLELQLISTPIFQRLRGLKQLAHVNYVFPGAEHSRFVHSLGVLYIMGLMTDHLLRKGDIVIEDVVIMRVAAILHDIGHYPLSHLGEGVYSYCKDNKSAVNLLSLLDIEEAKEIPLHILSSSHSKSAHHEKLGKYVIENNIDIAEILDSYGINKSQIGSIVTGQIGSHNMVYSQLLHSSLDADRLDYLLRDSYQTGVKFGLVDFEYLIRLLMVRDYKMSKDSPSMKVLVCDKKGQHVVEHFLMSRYFHYSQVVGHKTSLAFEGIIKAMYIKMVRKNKLIFNSYEEIQDNINSEEFLMFNDSMLYQAFNDYYKSANDESFNKLYRSFIKRIRPKIIYEIKDLHKRSPNTSFAILERELKKYPEKITEILGVDENSWGFQIMQVKFECIPAHYTFKKGIDEYEEDLREAIKIIDSKGQISYLAVDELSIINKLADYKSEVLRIFMIEEDGQSYDYDLIRTKIHNLLT
ncbi:HD domain-containing protein [Clostridium estertheticum]|uniref:HD domain-containing protein n=1 Tax=Clostridium estertheticum TaxID=238834 RepID=UPI001C0DDC36|nr:HD domain-containing protein [Clostridium estertheticum]MBU3217789.1 HD domain-containing protein [Clostridium estertheticum]WAG57477.1 HD domain-containing protein [Clostridium estertheticum]